MTFDGDTLGTALNAVDRMIGLSANEILEARDKESARLATWTRKLAQPAWLNPTLSGTAGHAWRVELDGNVANRFVVGPAWFVLLPRAHPFWPHYLLSSVHLRPDAEHAPQLAFPEATHELVLQALTPDRSPVPSDQSTWGFLTPVNASVQFQVDTDEQAALVISLVAHALVDAVLPAECDDYVGAREYWKSTLRTTAAHVRACRDC